MSTSTTPGRFADMPRIFREGAFAQMHAALPETARPTIVAHTKIKGSVISGSFLAAIRYKRDYFLEKGVAELARLTDIYKPSADGSITIAVEVRFYVTTDGADTKVSRTWRIYEESGGFVANLRATKELLAALSPFRDSKEGKKALYWRNTLVKKNDQAIAKAQTTRAIKAAFRPGDQIIFDKPLYYDGGRSMIAAGTVFSLHEAPIRTRRMKAARIMLIGTAAGHPQSLIFTPALLKGAQHIHTAA